MTQTVEAVYDGTVLRPETALSLEPNTRSALRWKFCRPRKWPNRRSSALRAPWTSVAPRTGPRTLIITSMATAINPGDEVFLDTSYALALSASTDQFHDRALRLATALEAARARLVTTRAVLLEVGNALSRQRYRPRL